MGYAKRNLINSMRRLLNFHSENTTSESSLVHDIRNLLSGELTETMGPVDRDPPHHAPSETIEPVALPEEVFAIRNTGFGACEAVMKRDNSVMNVAIPVGDEPLTKRERFAMEIMKSLTTTTHYILDVETGISGTAIDAVLYADALIAELAKERK